MDAQTREKSGVGFPHCSHDIAQVAQTITERNLQCLQEALGQVAQTDAATECSRALMNTYAMLMNESAQALLGIASDTQEFIYQQFETSARGWQQAGEAARNFLDAASVVLREIEARSLAD